MADLHRHCLAVDPLESRSASGAVIHRHCWLKVGHDTWHESKDGNLQTARRWPVEKGEWGETLRINRPVFECEVDGSDVRPGRGGIIVQPTLWT